MVTAHSCGEGKRRRRGRWLARRPQEWCRRKAHQPPESRFTNACPRRAAGAGEAYARGITLRRTGHRAENWENTQKVLENHFPEHLWSLSRAPAAEFAQRWPKSGRHWPEFGHNWQKHGQIRPNLEAGVRNSPPKMLAGAIQSMCQHFPNFEIMQGRSKHPARLAARLGSVARA